MPKFGYIPDPDDRRDYPATMRLAATAPTLPTSFSLRKGMSAIRDQGNLGSCVGFACAALKEWQERWQRPLTPYRDVSEMWIYWKAKGIDIWPQQEGTGIRYALKVLAKSGVPTEAAWPYVGNPGHYPPTKYIFWAPLVARWAKIGSYYRVSTINEILEWLVCHGPVVIGIPVGETILHPVPMPNVLENAFVGIPKTFIGGHAITLTGYNDNSKVLQFRNSWGANWGQHGYGYIPYNYLDAVAFDAWAILDE